MKQLVVITKRADRHADLHTHDYAVTWNVPVECGETLSETIASALEKIEPQPPGAYDITISEPYE